MLYSLWVKPYGGEWIRVAENIQGKIEARREADRLSNARQTVRAFPADHNPNERLYA